VAKIVRSRILDRADRRAAQAPQISVKFSVPPCARCIVKKWHPMCPAPEPCPECGMALCNWCRLTDYKKHAEESH